MSAKEDLRAANEALGAAIRVRGSAMDVWDLVTGFVALWRSSLHGADPAAKGAALDVAAGRLIGLAVSLVGRRRARAKLEAYADAGADREVS